MADYPDWITYAPLNRSWDLVRNATTTRLCEVKGIAIHYTQAPGQPISATRDYFNGKINAGVFAQDLNQTEQGGVFGAHFIVGESAILALAPDPTYIFNHAGDDWSKGGNPNRWSSNTNKYVRGGANPYTIGIEHYHPDETGKFTEPVLKNSHQLVSWLRSKYGSGIDIGRHYDYTGKACPVWYAPVILGSIGKGNGRAYDTKKQVLFPNDNKEEKITEEQERGLKNRRWNLLLGYYLQSDKNNIPGGLL